MKKTVLLSVLMAIVMILSSSAQEVKFDVSKSELKWTAKKVTGEHWGNIKLKSGALSLKNGNIVSGNFVIDMTTITNVDLEPGEWHDKLIGHLKSDDFFSVSKFKESNLVITECTAFENNTATAKGNLTIKGITKPISFNVVKSGSTYTANVIVDRTLYDIRYGSKKFFEGIGDKMIYDEFTLDVKLVE